MRHIYLIILLIIAANAHSQNKARYEIFKAIGNVSNASSGQALKKGDAVKAADRLTIGKDSKAGILDRQQHRIYYSLDAGTYSVASIMRDARRRADNAVAAVNSEALNQSRLQGKRPNVNGVAYRGSEEENSFLQSVCNAIHDVADSMPDTCLTLRAVKDDDDAFFFSMTNETDSLLYVNVIVVRPEETPQLCLNVGMTCNEPYISVAPNSRLTLPEFVFADAEPADYYMFATFEPFDSQALTLLLNAGARFDEAGNAAVIVSPKITVSPKPTVPPYE